MFNDIIHFSKLNENKKAIEVGIGTGQATIPFLITGCDVTVIELGNDLQNTRKKNLKNMRIFVYTIPHLRILNVMIAVLIFFILQLHFIGFLNI